MQDPPVINVLVIPLFRHPPLQNVSNLLTLSLSNCCCLNGCHGYIHTLQATLNVKGDQLQVIYSYIYAMEIYFTY